MTSAVIEIRDGFFMVLGIQAASTRLVREAFIKFHIRNFQPQSPRKSPARRVNTNTRMTYSENSGGGAGSPEPSRRSTCAAAFILCSSLM